jgi:hypothetical protein
MKIRIQTKNQGGALVVTLMSAVIIGIILASYLTMVSNQNVSTMRSLAWNSSMPVVEAGVEAALTHLHYKGATNLYSEGWAPVVGGYGKTGTLDDGSFYQVMIEPPLPPPAADEPMITCLGQVPSPVSPAMILGGVVLQPQQSAAVLKRKVRVRTRRDSLFTKAMVADGTINMNGNNIKTDSFDSTSSAYSTNGRYDATKTKDKGDVATNSGLVNSLNVGNADIKGKVSTGPNGSVKIGSNGTVGDKAWVEGGKQGIQPGYVSDDMNMELFKVELPQLNWATTYSGTINGTNRLDGSGVTGYYKLNSFSGKVLVIGNVTVYVPLGGSMDFTGNSGVTLAEGAKLKIYVGAANAKISGNGFMNSGTALNIEYWGLDTNTSIDFDGNAAYTGSIYAPKAALNLSGGGNDSYDFVGASVTKTVSMNGHFNFHYDEALAILGPGKGYVVSSWNEVDPNQ